MNIVIIGAGRLGISLAKSLSSEDHNVTIIDKNSAKVENLVEKLDVQGVKGFGTHLDVLKEADVSDADLVVSVTNSDEINLLVCLMAKKLGAKGTVARVRSPEYNQQFEFMRNELGVSFMINPDFSVALEICRILQFPNAVNIETFANGRIDMAEFKVSEESSLCNKSISDISPKYTKNMLICAVERNGEVFIPNGDFVIKAKDRIHITGVHKELGEIIKNIINKKKHSIKNVMIIGASRIGIYLSDMLVNLGKNVVIIDKEKENCESVFELVPKATVVEGNANDHDFLVEEGLEDMDAIVTLTESDETNFLLSLFAQSLNISKAVTKINNPNLNNLLDEVGIDTIVNEAEITVSMITQYIRAKENISSSYMRTLYKLVDGKVEATEFLAGSYVTFLDKPLSEVKLKKNVLVAAINRGSKTIFPGGDDCIKNGDLVIIVSKDRRINNLNDILQ